jgi:hypothetical protein
VCPKGTARDLMTLRLSGSSSTTMILSDISLPSRRDVFLVVVQERSF